MGALIPKAFVPLPENSVIQALNDFSSLPAPLLKQQEGFRVVVHDENGELTLRSANGPSTLGALVQDLLCESASDLQELFLKGRQGRKFGWNALGFEVRASTQLIALAEEFLRKEGLLYIRYGLMNLPLGVNLNLSTNDKPSGDAISHPLWSPETWFNTPWEAKLKAKEVSDMVQLLTGEAVNLSACYAYFCLAELAKQQTASSS